MRLWLLPLLLLSSCGHLRLDQVPAAIDSNYPSAEITCNGIRSVGLGVCLVPAGQPVALQVQGYGSGSIRLDSQACRISDSKGYQNNQALAWSFTPTEECVIDAVVSPSYPNGAGVVVSALKGRVYVRPTNQSEHYVVRSVKLADQTDTDIQIPAEAMTRVVFRGCGTTYDQSLTPVSGNLTVKFSDLGITADQCIAEGAAVGRDVTRIIWQVWRYRSGFTPLPIPSITTTTKLSVTGDLTVAVIGLDAHYVFNYHGAFSLPAPGQTLRLLTVRGRTAIGQWDGKAWQWQN